MKKLILCCALALLGACSSAPKETPKTEEEKPKAPPTAPPVYRVRFNTTKGPFVVEVHRDWAPLGADRFYELIHENYYNGAAVYRVLKGFIAQFGINKNPVVTRRWSNMSIPDDPVTQHNVRGTLTFAMAGPSSRTTEVFINLVNNSAKLDKQGFAPVGKVVDGMTSTVDKLYSGYGEIIPAGGEGPDPGEIASQGNQYLEIHYPRIDYIKTAELVDTTPATNAK